MRLQVTAGRCARDSHADKVQTRAEARLGSPMSLVLVMAAAVWLGACGKPVPGHGDGAPAQDASGASPAANVLELRAVGMRFEGPDEIPSGWVTVRLNNLSGMAHFAMIERLPEEATVERMHAEVAPAFQRGLEALNAGDADAANAAFGSLPEWYGKVVYFGGPGLVSGGGTAETTLFLEPGRYVVECYVKTNGIFHSYSAESGQLGMLHGLTVTEAASDAKEPVPNVTLAVSSQGFEIVEGKLGRGPNSVKVMFRDQQTYPNFVGHDVHVVRLGEGADVGAIGAWMDWRTADGLQTPAPAVFLGGVNDMPAGSAAYFTLVLAPGEYAFVAEVPSPADYGLLLPFTIE
jgi:hypothetical protein